VPKTPDDYHALAEERGYRWLGPEVPNVRTKTNWECEKGHRWEAVYANVKHAGSGCPICVDVVKGARVSQLQRDLCQMLEGKLNRPFRQYSIDVALCKDGVEIAVEYDSWYWHAGREQHDAQRDAEMIAAGWRVLRIRSNEQLPSREQLDAAIDCLLSGEDRVEIVLDDWGVGPTRFEID
jgi:very-short-patch-repair endonuclease